GDVGLGAADLGPRRVERGLLARLVVARLRQQRLPRGERGAAGVGLGVERRRLSARARTLRGELRPAAPGALDLPRRLGGALVERARLALLVFDVALEEAHLVLPLERRLGEILERALLGGALGALAQDQRLLRVVRRLRLVAPHEQLGEVALEPRLLDDEPEKAV